MTFIEFFDKNVAENICTCLSYMPERVILLGDKYELLNKHANRYGEVLKNRGCDVEFICRTVNKNNIKIIIEVLLDIIDSYDDCVFDVTGGDDLQLVAIGMVWQMRKEKNIQIHRFNFNNNTVTDCDLDGVNVVSESPYLTVSENIKVHGGDIVYDTVKQGGTHLWNLDEELIRDIDLIWDVCKNNTVGWNSYTNMLGIVEKYREDNNDPMTTVADQHKIVSTLKNKSVVFGEKNTIVKKLKNAGILRDYKSKDGKITVIYKNQNVKTILTKAGLALEMKTYALASILKDDLGAFVYNDVMTGVFIDWDGRIHHEGKGYDTENEIDVIMMHGMIPVFVSCKNGQLTMDELYKLNAVADRFGGKYAKKVLIINSLDTKSDFSKHLMQRAIDMNIRTVVNMQQMTENELKRIFKSFWCN